jgi:hypothetical protein
MTAFAYKWTNKETNEYYVGVHKGHVNDGYIGSGKKFRAKYNKYPELFEREILQEFNSYEDALVYEANVVTMDTLSDPKCLNLKRGGEGGGVPGWASRVDFKKRVDIRKQNAASKGMSYGQHLVGKPKSDELKLKLSNIAQNRQKVKCPHCNKIGSISQMKQWHYDRCKEIVS